MPKASPASIAQTLDSAGREYLQLLQAEAALSARKAELQTLFREHYELGAHLAGTAKVSIRRNNRPDAQALTEAFPRSEFPDYYKHSIDTAVVKRFIAPADYETFLVAGDNTVIVTPIDESI